MDRVIVYDGALPQTTDILQSNKNAMAGQAYQNMAILGQTTVVSGLAIGPTAPASLQVTIGQGSIYSMDPMDATAYGDLGLDISSSMKQGILAAPVTLTITPPVTVGFEQYYLVQVELLNVDGGSNVLSYFNASNPAAPFSGPANAGTSNFTSRACVATIALKAGVAATSGSAVQPTPDAGFTGLYIIRVINGQTQITSVNWSTLGTAPFFTVLPQIPANVQAGTWVWAIDTGAVNAMVAVVSPVPLQYTAGMGVRIKALITNTGAVTLALNGLAAKAVVQANGAALTAGAITSGQVVDMTFDGTNFQINNYLTQATSGGTTNNFNTVNIPYVADSGAVNAMIGTYSPVISALTAGLLILIKAGFTNTSTAVTMTVNAQAAKSVVHGDGTVLAIGDISVGQVVMLLYDGTKFQIANGARGANGTNGLQGPAGTVSTTLGAIGSFAFGYSIGNGTGYQVNGATGVWNGSASIQAQTGGAYHVGTWQLVSCAAGPSFLQTDTADFFSIGLFQRIA